MGFNSGFKGLSGSRLASGRVRDLAASSPWDWTPDIQHEAGWAPQRVWAVCKRQQCSAPTVGNQTPIPGPVDRDLLYYNKHTHTTL